MEGVEGCGWEWRGVEKFGGGCGGGGGVWKGEQTIHHVVSTSLNT